MRVITPTFISAAVNVLAPQTSKTGCSWLIKPSSDRDVRLILIAGTISRRNCLGARLLAVSKGHPAESIRVLASCGQRDFGESRLQEALPKQDLLADLGLRWHFIGRLQSNKVRGVVRAFPRDSFADSLALAERVSRIAGEEATAPGGAAAGEAAARSKQRRFLRERAGGCLGSALQALSGVSITGLMTMAPLEAMDERPCPVPDCRALADRLGLAECSMGMSGDWRSGRSGSTWLRLGSCLFGAQRRQARRWMTCLPRG